MNKQYAHAFLVLLLIPLSQNVFTQEPPHDSNPKSDHTTARDLERETLNAITSSEKLEPLSDTFCKSVLSLAPEELQKDLDDLFDLSVRYKNLPCCMILHGATGSGKSTLAEVIAQKMEMPFYIVRGSQLPNEYINSGNSGLRRIGMLASENKRNVIIDEFETLTQKIEKNDNQRVQDHTAVAFWQMIDSLRRSKLLFIGTTNDLRGMPDQIKSRLRGFYYEIPYQNSEVVASSILEISLADTLLDSLQTKEKIVKAIVGISTRDIEKLIFLTERYARRKNRTAPIITFNDFKKALKKLKVDEKVDSKIKIDWKKIFNYGVQGVGGVASLVSIGGAIYTIKTSAESLAISRANLRLATEVAQFNMLATLGNLELAKVNSETAIKALAQAVKGTEIAEAAKTQSAIIGGSGVVIGTAAVIVAAKAAGIALPFCTIS